MRKSIISVILFVSLFFSLSAKAADIELQNNIPDRYVVVPGDTLWGIASRFLKDPWLWAQIWGLNREQVKNPYRIYPGDVIVLEKTSPPLRPPDKQPHNPESEHHLDLSESCRGERIAMPSLCLSASR